MRTFKKIAALMLALAIMVPVFLVGCGPKVLVQGDETKTVLQVVNYAGGFGKQWILDVEKRFEAAYANVSFEEGKMGVDVVIDNNKDQGEGYITKVDAQPYEVYFPGNIYYYEWVNSGKMLDITDVVTESLADKYGIVTESGSILDKMLDSEKEFYGVDGKYYAIPHHESQPGIVYDKDLFEQKRLYFAKNGCPSEPDFAGTYKYTGTGDKSKGPDGEYGTSDDGLPATYEEFFVLCEYMKKPQQGNITPFLWTGLTRVYYTDLLLAALAADYEGAELASQYSYTGTMTHLVDSINADGTVNFKAPTEITEETGYLAYQSAGRYYALTFLEKIIDNRYYSNDHCYSGTTNLVAQSEYLKSIDDDDVFAFLVEGNWWENEAYENGTFDEIVKLKNDDYFKKENRNFAFLPLPKATADKIGEPTTLTTTEVSLGFIKSSIKEEKKEIAKLFLKFCYTDESLNAFTKTTGIPAALQYELDADVYNGLSSYSKSICDIKNSVIKPYSDSLIHKNTYASSILMFTFGDAKNDAACNTLKDNASAKSHFESILALHSKEQWEKSFSKYFD